MTAIKLNSIEGLMVEKIDYDGNISGEATPEIWKAQGRHDLIDEQGNREITMDREKLAKLIWCEHEVMPPDMGYWESTRQTTKDKYLRIADAIIANQSQIIKAVV